MLTIGARGRNPKESPLENRHGSRLRRYARETLRCDTWNPEQYERFRAERSRPFFDLLAMVRPAPDLRVLDLGCGSGELTRHLHDTLEARRTLGLDRSENMLERAQAHSCDNLAFVHGDLEYPPLGQRFDLVFSNAALHWVDGHVELLERLVAVVAPGGQLAVQVPANHNHLSHRLAAELAREEPFGSALAGFVRESPVLDPSEYACLLHCLGCEDVEVIVRVYMHGLSGPEEIVEWVKGTLLTAYQSRLPSEVFEHFVERYRARLLQRLEPDSPYLYPFQRIFFLARRPEAVLAATRPTP